MREWSAGVIRCREKAITGTKKRMKHLPVIEHFVQHTNHHYPQESHVKSKSKGEENIVSEKFGSQDQHHMEDAVNSKTNLSPTRLVYHYEDSYRFSRVLIESDLIFDSHFESGNLLSATRVLSRDAIEKRKKNQEYNLEIHHDLHSVGHTQWFYYSCSNTRQGMRVKFNLTNFVKPDSLFNYGMKLLMFSKKLARRGVGWHRVGEHICYYSNGKKRGKKSLYTLSFSHTFETSNDCCFFAFAYPYTYTHLQNKLTQLQKDSRRSAFFRRNVLCKTLSGNDCDILTVTEPTSDWRQLQRRSAIVITARVHPGESNASWICDGIIDFLTGSSEEAKKLRLSFIFKIVPML